MFSIVVGLGFNYARMAFRVSDYNSLQAENTELKIEKKNLEVTTTKLNSKIAKLETLSEELTALFETDFQTKKAGKGVGGSKTNVLTVDILSDILNEDPKADIESLKGRAVELENQLTLLQQKAEKRATVKRYTPTIWPIKGRVGSHHGGRVDPFTGDREVHLGLDISGPYNTPVHSPADGVVIFAARKSDYGNLLIIDHGNGLTTRLGHLSRFQARLGATVTKGQVVGYVGMTGRTTGPHLHYEVRVNDRPMNPRQYLPPAG